MTTLHTILLSIFIGATIVGYLLINKIPTSLHTPLMSGTNALSGITIVGALIASSLAITSEYSTMGYIFGSLAIIMAMVNVAGGFSVTGRMLKMFDKKKNIDE
jgi:NAD(P) transhydrogenase subunit alpha